MRRSVHSCYPEHSLISNVFSRKEFPWEKLAIVVALPWLLLCISSLIGTTVEEVRMPSYSAGHRAATSLHKNMQPPAWNLKLCSKTCTANLT